MPVWKPVNHTESIVSEHTLVINVFMHKNISVILPDDKDEVCDVAVFSPACVSVIRFIFMEQWAWMHGGNEGDDCSDLDGHVWYTLSP